MAELLAAQPGSWCPDQYHNPDNVAAYRPLAHELVAQLGRIDALVVSVGTGGHSAGIGSVLRGFFPGLRVVGVDTTGSTIFGQPAAPRLMRGLGSSIHPGNVAYELFDEVHWVCPAEAVWAARALARSRYASGGWSVGAVALTARWLATAMPAESRIVAVFPDGPQRYVGTVFDDAYCGAHGLLDGPPADEPEEITYPGERTVTRWTRCTTVLDPLGATRRSAGRRTAMRIPMSTLWRRTASFPPAVRLLMANQFAINLAFYMLMPYLAAHLGGSLGLAAWAVGLVLGVRNFSQQGMFLIGGTLADRYGYKAPIMVSCLLRTLGFGLLGWADTLPALIAASAATGFAGALFNPAVRAYLAAEAGDRRVDAFAAFNVYYQGGMLLGPLVGLALLAADFRAVCAAAALIFAALTLLQWRALPDRGSDAAARAGAPEGVRAQWRTVAANRPFLLFSLAMTGSYVLTFQVYLALPLAAGRSSARSRRPGPRVLCSWCRRVWPWPGSSG